MIALRIRKPVSAVSKRVVLGLAVCLLAVGCGSSASKLGGTTWDPQDDPQEETASTQEERAAMVLEFFKDKTWKLWMMSGRWSVLDDGRVKMDFQSFGTTQTFFARVEGSNLTLDMDGNKITYLKRK